MVKIENTDSLLSYSSYKRSSATKTSKKLLYPSSDSIEKKRVKYRKGDSTIPKFSNPKIATEVKVTSILLKLDGKGKIYSLILNSYRGIWEEKEG